MVGTKHLIFIRLLAGYLLLFFSMIQVIIQMKVLSEKHMELSQTIVLLCGSTRMEKGCKRCDFCQSIEDENQLFLLEEWDTQGNLMTHQKSEHFKVLRGAMSLLEEPYKYMVYTDYPPVGRKRFNLGLDECKFQQ
jgi:quinol monooxygenase YgiN